MYAGLGLALLALLLADIFFTVLHPQAHGGPLNRYQNRFGWRALRAMARPLPDSARDRWLSLGGPGLSSLTLLAWAGLLLGGFALVYFQFPGHFEATQFPSPWTLDDALYVSGVVAATLGMGDILPRPGPIRMVFIGQGLLAFMLVTIAVSYILSVYSAFSRASSFATEVWAALGDDPSEGIQRRLQDLDRMDRWAEAASRALAGVVNDHSQYPILHYFRPWDARESVVVQAGALLELFETLSDRPEVLQRYPSLLALRNVLHRYLEEVSRRFVHTNDGPVDEDDEREWRKRHRRALRHLGFPGDATGR